MKHLRADEVLAIACELFRWTPSQATERLDVEAIDAVLDAARGDGSRPPHEEAALVLLGLGRLRGVAGSGRLAVASALHLLERSDLTLDVEPATAVVKTMREVVAGAMTLQELVDWVEDRLTVPRDKEQVRMFERFTDRARKVLALAQDEARLLNHGFLGTEHLLLGMLSEGTGVAGVVLGDLGVTLDGARTAVETIIGQGPAPIAGAGDAPFTPRSKKVLELALKEAVKLAHNYIGTEHLLIALVDEGEGVGAQVLTSFGLSLPDVRAAVLTKLGQMSPTPRGRSWVPFTLRTRRPPKPASEALVVCSFCGKNQKEVAKVIAGPGVYICSECVSLCVDIIAEELPGPSEGDDAGAGGPLCSRCGSALDGSATVQTVTLAGGTPDARMTVVCCGVCGGAVGPVTLSNP